MEKLSATCWLFDAAIVPFKQLKALSDGGNGGYCLYAEHGQEAEVVAPWLFMDSPQVRSQAVQWQVDARHMAGVAALEHEGDSLGLMQHLCAISIIKAPAGRRFYLRFADMRALADVWSVLQEDQRGWLLGPVRRWRGCRFPEVELQLSASPSTMAFRAPLSLSTPQFETLLRKQRDTQCWQALIQRQRRLGTCHTLQALYAYARAINQMLEGNEQVDAAAKRKLEDAVLHDPQCLSAVPASAAMLPDEVGYSGVKAI